MLFVEELQIVMCLGLYKICLRTLTLFLPPCDVSHSTTIYWHLTFAARGLVEGDAMAHALVLPLLLTMFVGVSTAGE